MSAYFESPTSNLSLTDFGWTARFLRWLLMGILVAICVSLAVVPWQQSIRGTGRVVAYAPVERMQVLEAPIMGRVVHWYVQEGQEVEHGQIIAELSDNDPEILARLQREYDAAQQQVSATLMSIAAIESRISSMELERMSALQMADEKVRAEENRVRSAQQRVDASRAAYETAMINVERQRVLEGKGLVSTRDLELAELQVRKTQTDLESDMAQLEASKNNAASARAEKRRVGSGTLATIESARSSLQSTMSTKAKTEADLARVEVRMSRQQSMRIEAPRRGTVMRFLARQGGEFVKAGEPVVLFVPKTSSRAVEVWVDGNDAPLITKGRHVRLQFEGWPAVQFVGWPAVAVGTFPGRVDFVDASDDGRGRFRILVVPEKGEAWPESRYLRQGVRANAWVLLNQVSIGFELWRQLNGFPPALGNMPPASVTGGKENLGKPQGDPKNE